MRNLILQHFDGEMRPLDYESQWNIMDYADMIDADYRLITGKPFRKNLFYCGTSFGYGFYLSGLHWITHSLTFDENFKVLVPFALQLLNRYHQPMYNLKLLPFHLRVIVS